jgi:hypothetical protein
VAPNNFMCANAGAHLSELRSLSDLYDVRMVGLGLVVGAMALLPVLLTRNKPEAKPGKQQ